MKNCVSINLKRNEIIIKLNEDAEQIELISALKKKLPDLKKLYKDEKTPIRVVGKVLKNKEIAQIQELIKSKIDVDIDFDMPKSLGLHSIKRQQYQKPLFTEVHCVQGKSWSQKEV